MLTNVEMSAGGSVAVSPSRDATAISRHENQLNVRVTPSWEKRRYVTRDALESERIRGLQKRKLPTFILAPGLENSEDTRAEKDRARTQVYI